MGGLSESPRLGTPTILPLCCCSIPIALRRGCCGEIKVLEHGIGSLLHHSPVAMAAATLFSTAALPSASGVQRSSSTASARRASTTTTVQLCSVLRTGTTNCCISEIGLRLNIPAWDVWGFGFPPVGGMGGRVSTTGLG